MYFLGINKKTPHSHQKTKIKFIFLAELMILILGKNVQLFYKRANYTFSPIKCFVFFRTIISVIFSLKKLSVLLHSVNTVAIATTLGDYDGSTGPSQPEREAKTDLSYFRCWATWSRLAWLWSWTGYGIADYDKYCWRWRQW